MRRPIGRARRASLMSTMTPSFALSLNGERTSVVQRCLRRSRRSWAFDSEALGRALDTHEYLDRVVADEHEAAKLGIRGVPAFVANQRVSLCGVQTVEDLTNLVERARLSA